MSNLTRLQAVSSSLDTAINKAENLPDAEGGGGASVETCDVTVSSSEGKIDSYLYTKLVDGELVVSHERLGVTSTVTLTDAVVGSPFACTVTDAFAIGFEISNGISLQTFMFDMEMRGLLYGRVGTI